MFSTSQIVWYMDRWSENQYVHVLCPLHSSVASENVKQWSKKEGSNLRSCIDFPLLCKVIADFSVVSAGPVQLIIAYVDELVLLDDER